MSRKFKNEKKDYPSITQYLSKVSKAKFVDKKINDQLKRLEISKQNPILSETTEISTIGLTNECASVAEANENSNIGVTNLSTTVGPLILLENKLKISEENLKVAKNLLRKASDMNLEKDLKIQQLMKQNVPRDANTDMVLFKEYLNRFDVTDMVKIRSIGPGPQKDSKFINVILKSLYKNELYKLENRSATGKKFKGEKKLEVSFEKKELMKNMLNERVRNELCDPFETSNEFFNRVNRLNTFLRNAISNSLKKIKRGQKVYILLVVLFYIVLKSWF